MNRIYSDNSQSIGNTPLVRLNRVTGRAPATCGENGGRNGLFRKGRIGRHDPGRPPGSVHTHGDHRTASGKRQRGSRPCGGAGYRFRSHPET